MAYPDKSVVNSSKIIGTTTNDSAKLGYVGEFVTATLAVGSAISLSTNAGANIVSLSLTAGDWDLSGVVNFNQASLTATSFQSGASITSNTLPTQPGGSGLGTDSLSRFSVPVALLTGVLSQQCGPVKLLIAATTTVYLVAQAAFSLGNVTAFGTLRARRIR